jgi:cobalt/nickel transport system permease protein
MSHIHLPDGVLPVWLWVSGFVVTVLVGAVLFRSIRKEEVSRRLPLLGMMAAVMVLGASAEVVPIAYHVNLTVISGILLGPSLIFLATLVVNVILAMFGHGGITVLGLNTLTLSIEGILGYYLFQVFWGMFRRFTPAVFLATFLALLVSTVSMIGVVGLGTSHFEEMIDRGEHRGVFEPERPKEKEDRHEAGARKEEVSFMRFVKIVLSLGFIGWILEGAITTLIARYIYRIRPDLLRLRGIPS